MIGFFNAGRAGNYLWQAATAISLALKNGVEFSVPNRTNDPYHNPIYLQHLVNPNWVQGRADVIIQEQHFHYAPIEYKKEWNDKQVVLNGFWQSWKYIDDHREEILRLFAYHWEQNDYVSVHIRRGDYMHLKMKHPEVTIEWYNQAMKMFPGRKFMFFSDDMRYCHEHFGQRKDCLFSEGKSIEHDLIDASCCSDNICSASTYSFWIYWLNQNKDKKGIFPKLWFCDGWDNANTNDILSPEIIRL